MDLGGRVGVHLYECFFRKAGYRYSLVHKAPSLRTIDGREVTVEERDRANIFFGGDSSTNTGATYLDKSARAILSPSCSTTMVATSMTGLS